MGRFLVFIAGLLVVVLFAALLVPMFIDWSDFRKEFEQQASFILGKKVVVHGSVDARLLPFPSVTMSDIRVGQDENGDALIDVARFSMDLELAPLMSGQVQIFDMRIEKPRATIKLLQDGTLDWVRTGTPSIPAKKVILEHVAISDGEIRFIDDQTGRQRLISGLNASLSAKSLEGPWKVDGSAALDGEAGSFVLTTGIPDGSDELRLKTRLLPDARPVVVELEGGIKFTDSKPRYEGKFTLADRPSVDKATGAVTAASGPRVKGSFALTNESITLPDYRLEMGDAADPYVVTGNAKLDTGAKPEFTLVAEGQQIDVTRLGASGEEGKTVRVPAIPAEARLQAVLAVLADIPIPPVPGRATLTLPAIVTGDTTLRDVVLDVQPHGNGWTIDRAKAVLPGRTTIEAKGELALKGDVSFAGDLLVASTQPSGLASWLSGSVDPAIRPLRAAGFSAKVNLTPELQQFEGLEIGLGDAQLKGSLERQSPREGQPSLSVDLAGDTFDFGALRALVGLFGGDDSVSTLLTQTIAARISAKNFSAFDMNATGVEAVFQLANGRLTVDRLDVDSLAGASLKVSGTASPTEDAVTADFTAHVTALDPGEFLRLLQAKLPAYPVLDRLVQSSAAYTGTDLTLQLKAGGDGDWPVTLALSGSANGSTISGTVSTEAFALSADTGLAMDLTLENPQTEILLNQAGLDWLPYEADPDGVLGLSINKPAGQKATVSLSLLSQNSSFSARGEASLEAAHFLDGSFDLSVDTDDAEPYVIMSGLPLPQLGYGLPLQGTAKLEISADAFALTSLDLTADQNNLVGNFSISRDPDRVLVTGALDAGHLDLGWLTEAIGGPVKDPETGALSSAKLPPAGPNGFDVDMTLSATRFDPGLYGPIADFSTKLTLINGALTLSDAKGSYAGGALKGRFAFANADGSGFLQAGLELSGGDLAAVQWASAGKSVLNGSFDLTLALEGSGKSMKDLGDAATGSGTMVLKDVAINGLDTDQLRSVLGLADLMGNTFDNDGVAQLVSPLFGTGPTRLGTVAIPFSLASGVVRAETVSAASDTADLSANAEFEPLADRIDAGLQITFKAGDEALAGADPTVALSWKGSLAAPDMTMDVSALTGFLSMRAFEKERRRVEILQSNVLEKQRLRREAALFKFMDETRAAAQRALENEARRRQIAKDRAAARAAADAAAKAAAEKAASDIGQPDGVNTNSLPVPEGQKVIRGRALVEPVQ